MFSRKKITVVSLLLGGLALTCAGAPQAYAAGITGHCSHDAQGNRTCIYRLETIHTTKDGKRIVKHTRGCSSTSRNIVAWPSISVLSNQPPQTRRVGPVMNCSNSAPPHRDMKESRDQDARPKSLSLIRPVQELLRPLTSRLA
ncbi:hypothetical protein SSP35_03_04110 [Streptomyces sp. NBRC 110611]|uniref:hypothetical protein n=1 Tax=Streptomyces sp. NBRC 110611 TaxID=1621259 RepID=UPI000834F69F|nr:hypothetical protein [Streptomyces sp. NBRC 110611]GAU66763.1 hypothetical protein SSP35_03_04110 [Streptomyces sp. NBRC 110611]